MHHQSGVRTVVAGGRPELGPVQAVGGNRGAQAYTALSIDEEIEVAEILNTSLTGVLPDRTVGNFVNFAEFNIKDAVRPGETFPLQFAYEAATCRIFYTQHTVYNYLNLWNYVVDAIWRNPSLCIDGSANGTTILPTNTTGPARNGKEKTAAEEKNIGNLIFSGLSSGPQSPDPSSQPQRRSDHDLSSYQLSGKITNGLVGGADCSTCNARRGYVCASVPTCVNGKLQHVQSCQRACQKGGVSCDRAQTCYSGSGPSFCLDQRQSVQISSCRTPTRNLKEQTTKAVGGNFHLPFSRTGPKNIR